MIALPLRALAPKSTVGAQNPGRRVVRIYEQANRFPSSVCPFCAVVSCQNPGGEFWQPWVMHGKNPPNSVTGGTTHARNPHRPRQPQLKRYDPCRRRHTGQVRMCTRESALGRSSDVVDRYGQRIDARISPVFIHKVDTDRVTIGTIRIRMADRTRHARDLSRSKRVGVPVTPMDDVARNRVCTRIIDRPQRPAQLALPPVTVQLVRIINSDNEHWNKLN
jgi:hypothetical protein